MTALRTDASIADYDSFAYDYRTFWDGRDYEQWAEAIVLARILRHLPPTDWFADFGGGFGRNLAHCLDRTRHAVLIDYSVNNLCAAAEVHAEAVRAGALYLVRADLRALPFRTAAFDASMTVRVLHHLRDADLVVSEMLRTVRDTAVIDVPIKNHVLARLRALKARDRAAVRGAAPRVVGTSDHPFSEFQLEAVRQGVARDGFTAELIASVNNLRRWDQLLPRPLVRLLTPVAHGAERVLQRAGRGWWGPNQFLLTRRRAPVAFTPAPVGASLDPRLAALAARICCPACRGDLDWTPDVATCLSCVRDYPRVGFFWDFTC